MVVSSVLVAVVLAAALAWSLRSAISDRAARRTSEAVAARTGLAPEPDAVADAAGLLRRRALIGAAGAVLGGSAVAVWFTALVGDAATVVVWALVGAVLGRVVAIVVLAAVQAYRPLSPDRARMARTVRTGVRDYVPEGELGLALGAALLPVLVLLVHGATVGAERIPAGAWPVAVPLVALALAAVTARRLVGRPQPAHTEVELAWDDALRARTLRDLVAGVGVIGASYGLLSVAVVGVVPTAPLTGPTVPVLSAGYAVAGLLCVLVTVLPGPTTRFRRRLWSDVLPAATAEEVAR